MEELIDAVPAVRLYHLALVLLRHLLNRVAVVSEQRAWFHLHIISTSQPRHILVIYTYKLDRLLQALSCRLYHANVVGVLRGRVSDVVRFVQISVESAMVHADIDVEDVAIDKRPRVRNTVADDLVHTAAVGFREVTVVEWRRVALVKNQYWLSSFPN